MRKVRSGNQERFQQLEDSIQAKLTQAAGRRQLIEAEQREKLRTYVSWLNGLVAFAWKNWGHRVGMLCL